MQFAGQAWSLCALAFGKSLPDIFVRTAKLFHLRSIEAGDRDERLRFDGYAVKRHLIFTAAPRTATVECYLPKARLARDNVVEGSEYPDRRIVSLSGNLFAFVTVIVANSDARVAI